MLRPDLLRAAAVLLLAAGLAAGAAAQLPVLPKPATSGADAPPAAVATSTRAEELRRELAAAQKELEAIEANGPSAGAPPGTPASESSDRRTLARQLVAMTQQQIDVLERANAAAGEREVAERAEREWTGFATPPPYPLTAVDAIRDNLDAADARIANARKRRALFERFAVDVETKLKASQAAARTAAEAADAGRDTPQQPQLEWARELSALRARVDVVTQGLLQTATRGAREEEAAAQYARDLARRQLAAAGAGVALAADELARVKADIDERTRLAERALDRANRDAAAAVDARTTAEAKLAQLRAAPAGDGDAAARAQRETDAEREAILRREVAATAVLKADLLRDLQLVLAGERTAWDARQESLASKDPVRARAAYERLTGSLATLRTRRQYLDQEVAATAARLGEVELRLRAATGVEAAHLQQIVDALHARESVVRDALKRGEPLERVLDRFRADLEGQRSGSFVDEVRDAVAGALLHAKRVWNYEMFTVDDVFETADGRKLNVSRGVTIGKTAGAVLIVVVGYWLVRWFMRRTERVLVARGRVAPQSAALLRGWVLLAVMVVLVVFALASAGIPLTVFAFLGGALAIAAGFGLQTLLKNLVAGIILLVERPMRLGDLVDVESVRGRVTAIGIRASTIRTADGIESMIPNSVFLEQKLTNWTYTSSETRQTLTVSVAYGTPLRTAADALAGVLARHGLVRRDPAPQVYLEEYADSAVRFALTYWVDMTPESDSRRVKSDLLHMIDTAFAEAGIRMPFPQLDVHLDPRGA